MLIIGGLREVVVSSCSEHGDESESRLCDAAVRTALVAARSSSCSGSHSGCTQRISMVGSFAVAYCAPSAQISRAHVMALRYAGARESRSWLDFMICTRRMNQLERIDMCTVVPNDKSVSDVLNGLIYLTLRSPTHVERPFRPWLWPV